MILSIESCCTWIVAFYFGQSPHSIYYHKTGKAPPKGALYDHSKRAGNTAENGGGENKAGCGSSRWIAQNSRFCKISAAEAARFRRPEGEGAERQILDGRGEAAPKCRLPSGAFEALFYLLFEVYIM